MKVANLWYYFYNAGGTPKPPVSREDFSRTWPQKFHGHAYVDGLVIAQPVLGRSSYAADAAVGIMGVAAFVALGTVSIFSDVSIDAQAAVGGLERTAVVTSVQTYADAEIELVPIASASLTLGSLSWQASSQTNLESMSLRSRLGSVRIDIGPDQVLAEEEELFLLLELA